MKTVEIHHKVNTYEIDALSHVSNIAYIRWLEMARSQLLEECEMPVKDLIEAGFGPVLVRTEIDYLRPVYLGDQVVIRLWISKLGTASAILEFEILANSKVVSKARQRGLFVEFESGKPRRLTPDIRSRFLPYVLREADSPEQDK